MSDNVIKGPFGQNSNIGSIDIPEDQIPTVLLCAGCGNSLFVMLLMPDGDIAPVCQHCQLEFGYTSDGKEGIIVPEEYDEIGIPPDAEK